MCRDKVAGTLRVPSAGSAKITNPIHFCSKLAQYSRRSCVPPENRLGFVSSEVLPIAKSMNCFVYLNCQPFSL
jgi:hypothetical protein